MEIRVRIIKNHSLYTLQAYEELTGFKQIIKNCGPYKTEKGAFEGAKRWCKFFKYDENRIDKEVIEWR